MEHYTENSTPLGLYDPQFEHDACGIGAVVDIKGRKSHQTVSDALSIVERLEHRAGKDAEGKTGDGVGIMLQISHKFFSKVAEEMNVSLGNEREYGVGMFFFPQNEHLRAQAMKLFELVTRKEGLEFLAWREVPVNPDAVGQKARDCMPAIWQCFIKKPAKVSKGIDFDRKLYIVRRVFEQASNGTYVPSLSSRTIVYKGMFLVHDLRLFYLDLQDEDYESAIGMVHSRFSTNTNPSWMRAHPNRFILHNGEINTIKGNTDAMLAREESIASPIMQEDMNKILPIINTSGSDSAMLDNALEFMVMNGMDLPLAVMITIPEPWENNKHISQKKRDFYQYYATMLEPWDGPAAILFSDGDVVGAVLDRNGLRPSRYYITKDGRMILSSEVGVLPCDPADIEKKDRLRPGKMLLVDTVKGEVVDDEKLKEYYASREPYGEWIDRNLVQLKSLKIPNIKVPSYTGEGGEPEDRYHSESNSKIKQVASARFGVTSKYLVSAEEIQIKLAQGAKPGEGGNLPGAKVYPWIAKTRHSTTGVGLISPPPHHDIYSIEDLAELIYDLKNANRHANINVKLVSEAGVGTIAAGVAKGGAQVILVSGYDGGTGAAPRTSIKNAGLPWELGIAETHQTLILNGLRSRVRIESDSKLLSGRDVAISCMLGAEEFGFGTTLLMCEGCVMMRVCNLDTCPMGICTQNPELRKHFRGKPEYIINYLTFVAQELREYMAKLGVRTIDELVGRTDLLHVKPSAPGSRTAKMNLDCILHNPAIANSNVHFVPADTYDFHLENTLDMKVLMKKFKLSSKTPQSVTLDVSNTDRAFGAIFGSEITRKYGDSLSDDVYTANCTGAGGQSFGAFIPRGLTLKLTGDCNDYMGKGLSGGKIIVRPPEGITYKPEENIITGNVALYGATSGKAFVSGVAGERFCVRNSGATAVVEGVGDHGCEYMTGGTVVVLGQTGKNFAAGMTGGIAYVLDENWDFYQRVNKETVSLEPVEHKYDVATLKELIREHVEATGSPRGKEILDNFSEYLPKFKKVLPYDYDRMLRVIASMEERGLDGEQAQIEAFYAVQKKK